MINTPKDLSDIEVGLYKSGYGFCEKLVKECIVGLIDHPDIMCRFTRLNIAEHHAHSFTSYALSGISQSIHTWKVSGI